MATGSNTTTTSVETPHGGKIEHNTWISWRRKRGCRRFGKAVETEEGELHILCVPKTGELPNEWEMYEFDWAVAEGRISANSVWMLDDKLCSHELQYMN